MIAGLAFSTGGAIFPVQPSFTAGYESGQGDAAARITPAELQQLLRRRRAVIVDVRSLETYKASHIKGALSIPIDQVETRFRELPRNKMIATYCS
jgi:3-mercaptopyruvate sulfurtransferase SseA